MRAKEIFYVGLLAALAILSRWFLSTVESSLKEGTVQDNEAPLIYMDNFLANRMNGQGIREYTVIAPHLVQLPAQQGTQVETPQIEVFQDGQILEWLIRAERGWISADNDLIRLENEVSITRPVSSGELPLVITTRDLVIHPPENYAETAAAVRAETPGGVVTAVGLKAYLQDKKLELLSDVRGYYAAPPTP